MVIRIKDLELLEKKQEQSKAQKKVSGDVYLVDPSLT